MDKLAGYLDGQGLRLWLQRTHSLVALTDETGRILEANPALERLRADGALDSITGLAAPGSLDSLNNLLRMACTRGESFQGVLRLFLKPGDRGDDFDCLLLPLSDGKLLFIADLLYYDPALAERYRTLSGQAAQISMDNALLQKKLVNKQIEIDAVIAQAHEVAHTDELTYLANRRQIIGDLQREVTHAGRYGTPLSISMLDIDHFKQVNDTYGHAVGDQILRSVAGLLRDHIREPDIIGRYGGEEFLVILPNSSIQAAIEQAGRLCTLMRETPILALGNPYPVTISAGTAQFKPGEEDWQKFLSRADAAMYKAKAQGRNRWHAAT